MVKDIQKMKIEATLLHLGYAQCMNEEEKIECNFVTDFLQAHLE